jgi:hypothetical protein
VWDIVMLLYPGTPEHSLMEVANCSESPLGLSFD